VVAQVSYGKTMLTGKIKRTNTILYCQNWDAMVRFYRDVLNFVIHHETDWFVEFQIVGNSYLSIANAANASIQSADGNGITLSWQVEDVESAYNMLNEFGVKTSQIKSIWGAKAFYFFDPEGHRVELWA
jgi:catechol 2,3-dioxygenase-like lactoylglutathione lyase family enzyme